MPCRIEDIGVSSSSGDSRASSSESTGGEELRSVPRLCLAPTGGLITGSMVSLGTSGLLLTTRPPAEAEGITNDGIPDGK